MTGPGTNLWSADGNSAWSADGFPGISADGYEPTPLQYAVQDLAAVGLNVGALTYSYSSYGVPVGWVITGYVPFLTAGLPPGTYIPLTISEGPAPVVTLSTVPNVVGKYYYDAQLAILAAGMLIAPPNWVLAAANPGYVTSQSLVAGTMVNPQTQMAITVSGFPVVNQPGVIVPVP